MSRCIRRKCGEVGEGGVDGRKRTACDNQSNQEEGESRRVLLFQEPKNQKGNVCVVSSYSAAFAFCFCWYLLHPAPNGEEGAATEAKTVFARSLLLKAQAKTKMSVTLDAPRSETHPTHTLKQASAIVSCPYFVRRLRIPKGRQATRLSGRSSSSPKNHVLRLHDRPTKPHSLHRRRDRGEHLLPRQCQAAHEQPVPGPGDCQRGKSSRPPPPSLSVCLQACVFAARLNWTPPIPCPSLGTLTST